MELHKNYRTLIVFLFVFNSVWHSSGDEIKPCYIKSEDEDKQKEASLQCIQQLKPKIGSKYPDAKTAEKLLQAFMTDILKDGDSPTEDHCFMQCLSAKLGYITANNELDRSVVFGSMKRTNATEAFQKEVIAMWSACADQIDEVSKPEGGFKSNPCKFSLHLRNCVAKSFNQSKEKFAKLSC